VERSASYHCWYWTGLRAACTDCYERGELSFDRKGREEEGGARWVVQVEAGGDANADGDTDALFFSYSPCIRQAFRVSMYNTSFSSLHVQYTLSATTSNDIPVPLGALYIYNDRVR